MLSFFYLFIFKLNKWFHLFCKANCFNTLANNFMSSTFNQIYWRFAFDKDFSQKRLQFGFVLFCFGLVCAVVVAFFISIKNWLNLIWRSQKLIKRIGWFSAIACKRIDWIKNNEERMRKTEREEPLKLQLIMSYRSICWVLFECAFDLYCVWFQEIVNWKS